MFANRSKIEPCKGMTGECNVYISSTIISINVISIIINFIHMILLKTTPGSSRPNHFWILISLALADILVALSLTLDTSCLMHDIWLSANNVIGSAFFNCKRKCYPVQVFASACSKFRSVLCRLQTVQIFNYKSDQQSWQNIISSIFSKASNAGC